MVSAHLDALNARKARIEGQIEAEMMRPLPDSAKIASLKKQKLRVKEEAASFAAM